MHNFNSIVGGLRKTLKKLDGLVSFNSQQIALHDKRIDSHKVQILDHHKSQKALNDESDLAATVANNLRKLLGNPQS